MANACRSIEGKTDVEDLCEPAPRRRGRHKPAHRRRGPNREAAPADIAAWRKTLTPGGPLAGRHDANGGHAGFVWR
jgi:hypothetical protein